MSYNKNQDTRHHYQAGDKRRHPSIDESPDSFDQITVTAGHDFDTTVDDKNDLPLFSKEIGKVYAPKDGELYESRYYDLLPVVEDNLGTICWDLSQNLG